MQKTTQSEVEEAAKLVTKLREAQRPIRRAELLEIVDNERRLSRRLNYIKETFTNYILIHTKGEGYRLINRFTQGIKTNNSQRKKTILHVGLDIYSNPIAEFIAEIASAKERNRQLEIKGYKGVSGNSPKDYIVTVLDYDFNNDPFIYAVTDKDPTQIKTFKLSRADSFKSIKHLKGFAKGITIQSLTKDDFGFIIPNGSTCKIANLLLTAYAATMLVHDFPHLNEKIQKLPSNYIIKQMANNMMYEYIYSIDINYINIKPIGRVVTGLLDHIKVIGSIDPRTELSAFIHNTVTNSIGRNI